jgi:hypothetical protein
MVSCESGVVQRSDITEQTSVRFFPQHKYNILNILKTLQEAAVLGILRILEQSCIKGAPFARAAAHLPPCPGPQYLAVTLGDTLKKSRKLLEISLRHAPPA